MMTTENPLSSIRYSMNILAIFQKIIGISAPIDVLFPLKCVQFILCSNALLSFVTSFFFSKLWGLGGENGCVQYYIYKGIVFLDFIVCLQCE